ncbi:MAG TPA: class I SAM-dependent methyltransferase [Candidatus Wunengus sp. YC60]|uniref:class I SAM-dependent methyltransferase n=1 Tax=Candidatus Wunengus sp. YC60 TaxID=3367697 RepID=UPI004024D330
MHLFDMPFKHKKMPTHLMKDKKILDIGCGRHKLVGSIGLDQYPFDGVDIVHDLNNPLPFEDEEFDAVFANQLLEHVENMVVLVYEIHRILKPGGIFLAHVPYFRSSWAHIDPTHVRSFTINSMDYFVKGTYFYENYRFRNEAFQKIEVFIDNDYSSTILRRFFTQMALKNPFKYENSILSILFRFEQISYLLIK